MIEVVDQINRQMGETFDFTKKDHGINFTLWDMVKESPLSFLEEIRESVDIQCNK